MDSKRNTGIGRETDSSAMKCKRTNTREPNRPRRGKMQALIILNSLLIGTFGASSYPDFWTTQIGDYYYKVFRLESTFMAAEDLCVTLGGHLASIHSKEENDLIYRLTTTGRAATNYSDFAWIGLRRKVLLWNKIGDLPKSLTEGSSEWIWTDDTPVDYTDWAPGQPSNNGDEACTQMYNAENGIPDKHFVHRAWNDIACETKMKSFICKTRIDYT
ncbi:lectin C-type domain protein [Teladorsagia circumcincta]|uniref:Lectin C-type domain protein n=1 Tax=Teladorsagia circumcincta TaxID=45464 RepID=A0A2G9V1U2_TELCI|nr:lectin C-type domain protein [Teladorsagia circumcincta]